VNIRYHRKLFDNTCQAINLFWEKARTGAMPIVLAAWITNIAFAHVERLVLVRGKQDHSITDISEIADIQSHWTRIHTFIGKDPAVGTLTEDNQVFAAGSGLTAVPAALQT